MPAGPSVSPHTQPELRGRSTAGSESQSTTLGAAARHRFWNELSGSLPGSMRAAYGGRAGGMGPTTLTDLPTSATASPAALAGYRRSTPVSPSAASSPNGADRGAHKGPHLAGAGMETRRCFLSGGSERRSIDAGGANRRHTLSAAANYQRRGQRQAGGLKKGSQPDRSAVIPTCLR